MSIMPFTPTEPPKPASVEPRWKAEVRGGYLLLCLVAAIPFLLAGIITINAHNAGEKTPTAYRTVPLTQHGNTKYITEREDRWIRFCWLATAIGWPSVFVIGLFVHYGLKVDMDDPRLK